jgi:hypothetical protein
METFFIIADDIQMMAMGKTIAVGLYSDQIIMLHVHGNRPPNSTLNIAKLSMMLTFRGLKPGRHNVQADIEFPDGTPAPKLATVQLDAQKGLSAVLVFAFAPFPLPQEGTYRLRVRIAGETVVNTFTVVHEALSSAFAEAHGLPLAAPPPPAPAAKKAIARPNRAGVPAPTAKRAPAFTRTSTVTYTPPQRAVAAKKPAAKKAAVKKSAKGTR